MGDRSAVTDQRRSVVFLREELIAPLSAPLPREQPTDRAAKAAAQTRVVTEKRDARVCICSTFENSSGATASGQRSSGQKLASL